MKTNIILLFLLGFIPVFTFSQNNLITNIDNRNTISLNGKWNIIIDPYEAIDYEAINTYNLKENNNDKSDCRCWEYFNY